jgi:hypothetical protein
MTCVDIILQRKLRRKRKQEDIQRPDIIDKIPSLNTTIMSNLRDAVQYTLTDFHSIMW